MAQYTENLKAYKAELITLDGTATETTGDLAMRCAGSAYSIDIQNYTHNTSARLSYDPIRSQYASKCKLIGIGNEHIYIKSKSISGSGSLPSGSVFDAFVDIYNRGSNLQTFMLNWADTFNKYSAPKWFAYQNNSGFLITVGTTGNVYSNTSYTFDAKATIAGINDTNAPYKEVAWEDIVPSISNMKPNNNQFVISGNDLVVTYSKSVANAYDGTVIDSTDVLKWRIQGQATEHTISATDGSATIPADTLPEDSIIEWCIVSTTEHNISNTPTWQTITTACPDPVVNGLNPSGNAFVNRLEDVTLSFSSVSPTAYGQSEPVQSETIVKWRVKDDTEEHEIEATNQSATIPANTLPQSSIIEWCVITTTEYGTSNTPTWASITTTDTVPSKPINLIPNNTLILGDEDNVFRWTHVNDNGTPQAKADLQYSSDQTTWETLGTVIGSEQSYTVEAGTLSGGTKYWRVRTYNLNDESSEWSDNALIVVNARPPMPVIQSIRTTPLAKVTWQSTSQIGWRVLFTDSEGNKYDSGEQYGTGKTYTSPEMLALGTANVKIWTISSNGESNPLSIDFNVLNTEGEEIILDAEAIDGKVYLSFNTPSEYEGFYVFKNGTRIAKANGEYIDKTANGDTVYQIMGVSDGNYTLSNIQTVYVKVRTVTIFDAENDGELIELYIHRNSPAVIQRSTTSQQEYYNFYGKKFPVSYTSGHVSESLSITVTYNNDLATILDDLIGKVCFIKDKTGYEGYGILTDISRSIDSYTDITVSFNMVDFENEVRYE